MLVTRKGTASVFISGALALSLVAAGTDGATPAMGTASSSLSAVSLTVSGVPGVPSLSLLDLGTLATTDAAHPGNALGANFASVDVVPATVDGVAQGAKSIRSDEATDATTPALDVPGLGSVGTIAMAASASEDGARAAIAAASAQLAAVTDLLGIEIETLGIESVVTGESASQTQGLSVDGLDVSLGDLLPEELLAALPIDVLLELLANLPVGAPDVEGVINAINGIVASVQGTVDGVVATSAGVQNGIAAISAAIDDVADQQAIVDGMEIDEAAAQEALENAVANAAAAAEAAADAVAGRAAAIVACGLDLTCVANVDSAIANAQGAAATAAAAVTAATDAADQLAADLAEASSLLDGLANVVDVLTDIVNDLVAQLVALVNNLLDLLGDLLGALTDLSNSLGDVIDALLDVTLIGLGDLDLSMTTVSTGSVDTSSASFACSLGNLVVAGVELGGGSCTGDSLTGSLTGAVKALETALGALPLVGELVPNVSVDLMKTTSSVTEADGVVTATASVIPLVIDLPSVTIDPSSLVDGLIASLSTDLIDDLLANLPLPSELQGIGLGTAASQIEGLLGQEVPGLEDVEALIGDVVALLPDGLGLPALTTAGFNLTIDPTSTASFRPAAAAPAPAPATDPLPATGGGAIALAVLGLGGAWSLRRRR